MADKRGLLQQLQCLLVCTRKPSAGSTSELDDNEPHPSVTLASAALTKLFLHEGVDNFSMIKGQCAAIIEQTKQSYVANNLLSIAVFVSSLSTILESTQSFQLYEQLYEQLFLPVLDDNSGYVGFSQLVDMMLNLCKSSNFREDFYLKITNECTVCLGAPTFGPDNQEYVISIDKRISVFEVVSNLVSETAVSDATLVCIEGENEVSSDRNGALKNLVAQAMKALNGSMKLAKFSLRVLNTVLITGSNTHVKADQNKSSMANQLWLIVLDFYQSPVFERKTFAYIVWSVLFELLLDCWKKVEAWDMITFGLGSSDALLSKRSYSLLRRIVDTVSISTTLAEWGIHDAPGNKLTIVQNKSKRKKRGKKKKSSSGDTPLDTWKLRFSIFGSIFECLDGIQGHLVEAIWPQFAQLCTKEDYSNTRASLPYTHMLCDSRFISILLKKSWRSLNHNIKHWTVTSFIKNPPVKGVHWIVDENTITMDMLEAIHSPNYFRRHVIGIEKDLLVFLHTYIMILESKEKQKAFLKKYIRCTAKITRNDFPLIAQMKLFPYLVNAGFVMKGIIGNEEVKLMRDNFTQKYLCSTLSKNLLAEASISAIINFSEPNELSVSNLGGFLLSIRSSILQPNSRLHRTLQNWIQNEWRGDSTNSAIEEKIVYSNAYSSKISAYVSSISSLKNLGADNGMVAVAEEMTSQTLAYMLSLVPTIDDRISLVSPVFERLNAAYTHSYIPPKILNRLLNLFVGICSTASPNETQNCTWSYKVLAEMLGKSGRGELLSYLEREFKLRVNDAMDKRDYSTNETITADESEFADNGKVAPLVLGQLLKICPSDLRILDLGLQFIESIISRVDKLSGGSKLFAIQVLDEVLMQLLHPSPSISETENMQNVPANLRLDGIVNTLATLQFSSSNLGEDRLQPSKYGRANTASDFYASKWRSLSTIFAYLHSERLAKANSNRLNQGTIRLLAGVVQNSFEGATSTYFQPLLETAVLLFPYWHDEIVQGYGDKFNVDDYQSTITPLFKTAWLAFSEVDRNHLSSEIIDTMCMLLFHEKIMHEPTLHQDPTNSIVKEYMIKITTFAKGGSLSKRIMHGFAKQIFKVFSSEGAGEKVAGYYVSDIAQLVLYEEPIENYLHQEEKDQMVDDVLRGRLKYTLFHAHVMAFIDAAVDRCIGRRSSNDMRNNFEEHFIFKLTLHLLDLNFQEDWIFENYMPNSPAHGQKLRAWQCLCLLSRGAMPGKVALDYISRVCKVLDENHLPSIRYYMEIFLARCLVSDATSFLPEHVLSRYNSFNIRTPTLVSLLFSTAYVLPHILRMANDSSNEGGYQELLKQITAALYPWMGGSNGQARVISQHIVSTIAKLQGPGNSNVSGDAAVQGVLQRFQKYLNTNKDVVRMIKRQSKNFLNVDVYEICTLSGIMQGQLNMWGNIFPPDVLQTLKDTITECNAESIAEDHYMFTWVAATARVSHKAKNRKERANKAASLVKEAMYSSCRKDGDSDADDSQIRSFEFQRKILPWGNLDAAVEDIISGYNGTNGVTAQSRQDSVFKRKKQDIIVIASLVDKTPNLAGLSRTCEIFGAKKLVIPSKKYQDEELFSTISVTAEKWLNMEYVPEKDLKDYLLSCKKDGYTLVGLEQTSNSKSIETYQFKRKTAILLGKELEGIPPEFIDMLEDCIEIPQFGIVRSLNVHVSGSILLWEYTKQGLQSTLD